MKKKKKNIIKKKDVKIYFKNFIYQRANKTNRRKDLLDYTNDQILSFICVFLVSYFNN